MSRQRCHVTHDSQGQQSQKPDSSVTYLLIQCWGGVRDSAHCWVIECGDGGRKGGLHGVRGSIQPKWKPCQLALTLQADSNHSTRMECAMRYGLQQSLNSNTSYTTTVYRNLTSYDIRAMAKRTTEKCVTRLHRVTPMMMRVLMKT